MSNAPSKTDSAAHTARGLRVVAVFTWLVIGLIAGGTLAATLVDYFYRAALPARSVGGIGVMVVSAITTLVAIINHLLRDKNPAFFLLRSKSMDLSYSP